MNRQLTLLRERLAICQLPPTARWPALPAEGLVCVCRTADELSIVCAEPWPIALARRSDGWRCLKLEGPFDLAATGILAPLASALGSAGVSLLPIATFDTDYLLVRDVDLDRAMDALAEAGCTITEEASWLPEP